MCYFARKSGWRIRSEPATCNCPKFRIEIVVESSKIECLAEEARDETELSFGAAVCLGFVECLLIYFGAQRFGDRGALENLVLAIR